MKKLVLLIAIISVFCQKSYGYSDISPDYWGYKAINELSNNGILSGYPEGDFRPENKMSKAEFMKILCAIIGLKADVSTVSEHWADGYINVLIDKNIINISEYGKFDPDSPITRWEICKMIVNSFQNTKELFLDVKKTVFHDIKLNNIEEQRVAKILKDTGILKGYPDGTVGFANTSTRAEVSNFIYNLQDKLENLMDYGKNIIYEDDISVSNINDENIRLRKYQFAEDNEYCTTSISNIRIFKFDEGLKTEYKDVFNEIYSEENPYLSYRNKFGKGNYVLAIDFTTKNHTLEYDIVSGYQFLHVYFVEEDNINIIDSFDTDEIYSQTNKNVYSGIVIKPGESQHTSAFYILDNLPNEKFYVSRSITTLYDSKNVKNINASSFHSTVIYL